MDGYDIVRGARAHYLNGFREFLAQRFAESPDGKSEATLAVEGANGALPVEFGGFVCADFVGGKDGQTTFWEFEPKENLAFEPVETQVAGVYVDITALRWDNAFFWFRPQGMDFSSTLIPWFETWSTPSPDRFAADEADLAGIVHRVIHTTTFINVDFGTAAESAFPSLLLAMVKAGARQIRVAGTPPELEAPKS